MPTSPDKKLREFEVDVTFYVKGEDVDAALNALSDYLTIAYLDRGREFDITDYETHEDDVDDTGRLT